MTVEIEPSWVAVVIDALMRGGYTVQCKYDTDGFSWQNRLYTVTKGTITYAQDVRAQLLLKIPVG